MSRSRPINVFVLIDALGWTHIETRHFLSDLLPYRTPLRTVLGYSSGAIPTILTGRQPRETGHWNLLYYDPEHSPFRWMRRLAFLPTPLLDHRLTRKLLKELGRRLLGLGPLFECAVSPRLLPWFNWVEKRNIYAPGGIAGARSIFDQLAEAGIPHRVYSYHQYSDEEILLRAERDVQSREFEFFFLYLSEMDSFLHNHCDDLTQLERLLNWYAHRLRNVFEAVHRRDSAASFTVVSDHGMTSVRHHYDLVKDIDSLGITMPDDYLAVFDSTMARFWFFTSSAQREITRCVQSLDCGRILPEEELRDLGIFFPDRRYGDLVLLLNPGWLFSRSNFNGRGWMPAGMHGYHPDDPHSDAIFLSTGRPPVPVRTIADVYDCMRHAAGLATARPRTIGGQ